jgi:hypothetical protein
MLRSAIDRPVSCAVTLLDGLVLARSAFHHSVNYRSVVLFGTGRELEDGPEKRAALESLMEHVVPGRLAALPAIPDDHVRKTLVVALPIEEGSVKARTGPPGFVPAEEDPTVWAGVLPLALTAGEPWADEHVPAGEAIPACLKSYRRGAA